MAVKFDRQQPSGSRCQVAVAVRRRRDTVQGVQQAGHQLKNRRAHHKAHAWPSWSGLEQSRRGLAPRHRQSEKLCKVAGIVVQYKGRSTTQLDGPAGCMHCNTYKD
eukprot:5495986-Amphidinium_carterae.1